MEDTLPPPPQEPSPSGHQTRAKGKGREAPPMSPDVPPDVPQSTTAQPPPYSLRGKTLKRRADEVALDDPTDISPVDEESESTMTKSDVPPIVPRVQVDEPSPPRPTQRPRTESVIATGKVSYLCVWPYHHVLTSLLGQMWPLQEQGSRRMQVPRKCGAIDISM
jgi:hypothetical protein